MRDITLTGGLQFTGGMTSQPAPVNLFRNGEQGVWYDPSDFSTLFESADGRFPITTVERQVGLMLDKSKGLVLGPELVTNGNFSNGTTGWSPFASVGTASLNVVFGELQVATSSVGLSGARQVISGLTPGRWYRVVGTLRVIDNQGASVSANITFANGDVTVGFSSLASNSATSPLTQIGYFFVNNTTITLALLSSGTGPNDSAYVMGYDNISLKEIAGNHAFSTLTNRPLLSNRYNLLTYSERFDDASWIATNSSITTNQTTAPDGTNTADLYVSNSTNGQHYIFSSFATGPSIMSGVTYTWSVYLKKGTGATAPNIIQIALTASQFPSGYANFNINNGTVGTISNVTAAITSIGSGWYRCSITSTATSSAATSSAGGIIFTNNNDSLGRIPTYADAATSNVFVWGAQLIATNSLPSNEYQRIAAAPTVGQLPTYDTNQSKFPVYLQFDGSDDFLQTNSINFTSSDKMTIWTGVRRLVDSAFPIICELSSQWDGGSNGTFAVAGGNTGENAWYFGLKGTATVNYIPITYTPPITNLLSVQLDIAGASKSLCIIPRINGVIDQEGGTGTTAGTGNFGNHVLYIGRRGGTSLPFNGYLYSLIIRGAQTNTQDLLQTEIYVASKTPGITLI